MATSSILGADRAAEQAAGRDIDALGPSDISDSGSDARHAHAFDALGEGEIGGDAADLGSDTDASGTDERAAADHDLRVIDGGDVGPDHIEALGDVALSDDDLAIANATAVDIDALAADDDSADDEDESNA